MHDERNALTDAALDREIERALAVAPSPEFVARVRTRIESEPDPTAWRLSWVAYFAGGAVAALIIAAVVPNRNTSRMTGALPLVARALTDAVSTELPYVASAFRRTGELPSAARPERVDQPPRVALRRSDIALVKPEGRAGRAGNSDPEVLIDIRESNAIRGLIFAIRDGRVPVVQPVLAPSIESAPLTQIVIPPLTIDPIGPHDGLQGVRP